MAVCFLSASISAGLLSSWLRVVDNFNQERSVTGGVSEVKVRLVVPTDELWERSLLLNIKHECTGLNGSGTCAGGSRGCSSDGGSGGGDMQAAAGTLSLRPAAGSNRKYPSRLWPLGTLPARSMHQYQTWCEFRNISEWQGNPQLGEIETVPAAAAQRPRLTWPSAPPGEVDSHGLPTSLTSIWLLLGMRPRASRLARHSRLLRSRN